MRPGAHQFNEYFAILRRVVSGGGILTLNLRQAQDLRNHILRCSVFNACPELKGCEPCHAHAGAIRLPQQYYVQTYQSRVPWHAHVLQLEGTPRVQDIYHSRMPEYVGHPDYSSQSMCSVWLPICVIGTCHLPYHDITESFRTCLAFR